MAPASAPRAPRALLFDIGGVCVVSPMQAILDYEVAHGIPPGWVNFSISRASPDGSWHRLERGEIALDAAFFAWFKRDLSRPDLWREHLARAAKHDSQQREQQPPVPDVDAEALFWEMMRVSREPDAHMFAALKRLKQSGRFLLAALSNTVIFPAGHAYNDPLPPEQDVRAIFEVFMSSAHVGLRKPDPQIYELALSWMREKVPDLSAADVVFIDDIGGNLRPARDAGMRTIKVNLGDTKAAVKELEKITGLSLLDESAKL